MSLPLNEIIHGDCRDILKNFPSNSVDICVTDPPYGLEFMGIDWDRTLPPKGAFKEIHRVLKPGALCFIMSSPRQDLIYRMLKRLDAVGFNLEQSFMSWIYKCGFPKAYDISKAIDKKLGKEKERKVKGKGRSGSEETHQNTYQMSQEENNTFGGEYEITEPVTNLAKKWDGWKNIAGLKPALEPILMVNKPLSEKTIVDNVLKHGVGAINIDKCRIPITSQEDELAYQFNSEGSKRGNRDRELKVYGDIKPGEAASTFNLRGRFPANLLVSDKAIDTGEITRGSPVGFENVEWKHSGNTKEEMTDLTYQNAIVDEGDQSRYFDLDVWADHLDLDFDYSIDYDERLARLWNDFIEDHGGDVDDMYLFDCLRETIKLLRPDLYDLSLIFDVPKPSKSERGYGLEGDPIKKKHSKHEMGLQNSKKRPSGSERKPVIAKNTHPTVKPIKLMAYLIELGGPKDGVVLDPFVGSGTTCIAARKLGREWIGIDLKEKWCELARKRISAYPKPLDKFTYDEDKGEDAEGA